MTPLIDKNTTIPTKASQTFSTAEDNQTAVTVHVLQGERKMAAQNKSLGRFDLADIPPAPRGTPQIEVTFDIDANGIMHVSAKDKATGKEQSIQIKASSGLSDDEIDQMIKDAEAHAEEDKKFQELVEARNQADGLVHASRKSLDDENMQFEDGEKEAIESAANDLEEAIKGDDLEDIKAKTEALSQASAKMAERMYANAQQQAEAGQQPGGEQASNDSNNAGDDVVDAEFEEVNDKDNSKS